MHCGTAYDPIYWCTPYLVKTEKPVKEYRNILILLVVAAVLGSFYFILSSRTDPAATGQLFRFPKDDEITTIHLTNSFGSFTFQKNEEIWILTEPGNYRVYPEKTAIMEKFLITLPVVRMLDSELEEYGLSNPRITIDLTSKQNIHKNFSIGNLTPSQAQVYIKDTLSGKIYLCDAGSIAQLEGSLNAYRAKEVFSIDKFNISTIVYYKNGEKVVGLKKLNSGGWVLDFPYEGPVRNIEISEILKNMTKWSISGFPEKETLDISNIGLKDPLDVVEVLDANGKSQRIEFGTIDNGMVYTRTGSQEDIAKVFQVDVDFSKFSAESLLYYVPLKTTIDKALKIEIITLSESITLDIDHAADPPIISSNGQILEYEKFVSFFVKYISLSANGYDPNKFTGQPYMTMTTTINNGQKVTLRLYIRDSSSYYMVTDDNSRFFVNKDKVDLMMERLQNSLN
jgi:hypothetical protein